ncbi:MAG: hypothetical protein FWE11_09190 [Defluviitaleaceae bacterium]|nr:hypothetical protein [Defluviitaleaceae bacterium]
MNEFQRRLVLRYDPGQFTFRHFDVIASDEELYALARQLNSLQEDEVKQIVKVQVLQLR